MTDKSCVYRQSCPSNQSSNGLVYTFGTVMAKVAAESHDMKKLEKMFKKQLNEIEVNKEFFESRLKNKVAEVKQLHMQYKNKEESYERLAQEKRHLERLLEVEVMNAYHLSRQVDQLKVANKKLKIDLDHVFMNKNH